MALVDNRLQRWSMLCAMYFAQGVPWGFMVTALGNYLADRGVSDGDLGKLTGVVLLPWTFKLIWAPLIDTVTIRSMGRRRPWILGAEFMMAGSMLWLLAMGDLTQNLDMLLWMFFIHNCFASLQDVATDALAVDVLPANEQGRVNGMMWGSKLVGKALGAAGMALVIRHYGIAASVWLQFGILMVVMLFPLLLLERPGEKRLPWSKIKHTGEFGDSSSADTEAALSPLSVRSPLKVLADLRQAFSLVTTLALFIYGIAHNIGWGIVEVIHKPLFTRVLGWGDLKVSLVSGTYGAAAELGGAIVGGLLVDRIGRKTVMAVGYGGYGLAAIIFGAFPGLWHEEWFAKGYLIANPGFLAMGSVGFLSMAMRVSWTTAAATVFTIFMTVSNIGHVLGNKLVGPVRERLGLTYEETFYLAGATILIPLLLLLVMNPGQVDERKRSGKKGGDSV